MDRIYMSLLCSKWYLLPIPEQHCMCLMIAKAQNPVILMAGAAPLNLDTFVQVICIVFLYLRNGTLFCITVNEDRLQRWYAFVKVVQVIDKGST